MAKLDWRRASEKPARVLSWKEERLDRAADNWIAGQSLTKRPADKPMPTEPPKPAPHVRSPKRKPRWRKQARKEMRELLS